MGKHIDENEDYHGTGHCSTLGDYRGTINSSGGATIGGDLFGSVDTTGHVTITGDMNGTVKNTGGGTVWGDLNGRFETTGEVSVYGEINGLVVGGYATRYRKVRRTVTETYSIPATREVERDVWEPVGEE